ncbi:MAG: TolC family protein [Marinifilaceae bacterium]|jgi:outer membrane protein|nr:TolC family protein [Marinifilaceae bacterium]
MKKILSTIFFLTCIVAILSAQTKTWNLVQCIQHAKENNIDLKIKKLNTSIKKNNLKQTKFDFAPNLNASSNYRFSFGRSVRSDNTYGDVDTQFGEGNLSSQLTLFNGLSKWHNLHKSELEYSESEKNAEKYMEDMSLAITSSYLNILFIKEVLNVSREQVKLTKEQINRTQILVQAGTVPKGNLMEQKAQLAREELQVVNKENELYLELLDLAQFLDIKDVENFDVEMPNLDNMNISQNIMGADIIFNSALKFRPEITAANMRLDIVKTDLKLAKANRLPKLTFSASIGSGYSQDMSDIDYSTNPPTVLRQEMLLKDQLKNRLTKSLGFSLSIPIFNANQVNRNISNAKINIERSELELINTQNKLRKDIQQAYANATAARKKFQSSSVAIESSEEAFRYTTEKYNSGLVNSVEYNQEKTNLFKAKSELLQAKYDYIFRTKILDFYNGMEIKL